jgi:hypothetical protein
MALSRTFFLLRMFLLFAALAGPAQAEVQTMGFPPAHEVFPPLVADPTEPHFSFQVGAPVNQRGIAKVNIGDYLGIYRWSFNERDAVQINVGGAVNTRFDASKQHDLQVIDFYGNVPVDVALGPTAMRFMFYHVSSHLGDDYLREKNIQSVDNSWEALRGIFSIHPFQAFRFYAGYTHAVHTKPPWNGKNAVQGGMEVYFNNSPRVQWHPYLAQDLQSWSRSAWNPTYSAEIGIKTGGQASNGRGIAYYLQYITGPRYEGQFYRNQETVWLAGLKFQLSQALPVPSVPATPLSSKESNP